MLINIVTLIIGFLILLKCADYFVDGASSLAKHLHISELIVGIIIVSLGTTMPELFVSINSKLIGSEDLIFGNALGSTILNTLLILGIGIMIRPVIVKEKTLKLELPVLCGITATFALLFLDNLFFGSTNMISRLDGFILLVMLGLFYYKLIKDAKKNKTISEEGSKYKLSKSIFVAILGLLGVMLGSNMVVISSSNIAVLMGISQKIIGLTIVAFGTSLPELTTAVVASIKNKSDLMLGNIIGANILNICWVLGIPALFLGNLIPQTFNNIDLLVAVITPLILYGLATHKKKLTFAKGLTMLILFILYNIFIIF